MQEGFVIGKLSTEIKKPMARHYIDGRNTNNVCFIVQSDPPCSEPWARYRVSDLQEI